MIKGKFSVHLRVHHQCDVISFQKNPPQENITNNLEKKIKTEEIGKEIRHH